MRNNKIYLEWTTKANNDLEAAEILLKEKGPTDTICFHSHQAVEKYLKAYLVLRKIRFEKIHDLRQLAKLCAKADKTFLKWKKEFKILDAYYIECRYPPKTTVYSRQETKKVLETAQQIVTFIVDKITKDTKIT